MSTLATAYCIWLSGESSNTYSVQGEEACENTEKGNKKKNNKETEGKSHNS